MSENLGGRPTLKTPETVGKLENALQNGFTIKNACYQANIHYDTYYDWLKKDAEFSDKMDRAQHWATEKARQNIVVAINDGDVSTSKWWTERKDPEFSTKQQLEVNAKTAITISPEDRERYLRRIADGVHAGAFQEGPDPVRDGVPAEIVPEGSAPTPQGLDSASAEPQATSDSSATPTQ